METIRAAYAAWSADRSRAALVRLLDASQFLVFGVCYEILRHRQDAEDATQRVLLELQKGLADVRDADHFLHRVRLVAFRTALDTKRDRRRRIDRERKAADMTPTAPISDEVREAIHEAMAALDDESRALVIEHYFEKATLDEMGARRGVTGAAIWKRIESIKGKLRHGLVLAGLAAAASKADACLEAVTLAAPSTNLVGASTIAGGLMASKASTITVAVVAATLTFGIGLGGGLAIQASRSTQGLPQESEPAGSGPADRIVVSKLTQANPVPPLEPSSASPSDMTTDPASSRKALAEEIWSQFKRPRFRKDPEAQADTLPKLKELGPDLASFFVEKYRAPGLSVEQRKEAVRLTVACGGDDALKLIMELATAGPDLAEVRYCIAQPILWGHHPVVPFGPDLRNAALTLLQAASGRDRYVGMWLLTFGPQDEWFPVLSSTSLQEPDYFFRKDAVGLLGRKGGADVLAFLKSRRNEITNLPSDPRESPDVAERQKKGLEYQVNLSIETIEKGGVK